MLQRIRSSGFLLAFSALVLFLAGCGGGGGASSNIDATPFSRGTGPAQQAFDLVNAAHMVDYPTGQQEMLNLLDIADPSEILATLDYPDTLDYYYPLDTPPALAARGSAAVKSPTQLRDEIVFSRLAGMLARQYRSGIRATQAIDFTSELGVHWVGSYSFTQSATSASAVVDVTGTRDNLRIVIRVNASFSTNTAMTTFSDTFSYSLAVTNTVPSGSGTTPVAINATGSGTGNFTESELSVAIDQMMRSTYQHTVGGRIVWKSTTLLNISATTYDNSESYTYSYTADTWQFARDGYWVHATIEMQYSAQETISPASFNESLTQSFTIEASDGYQLTYDGETGLLRDNLGNTLATLTYDESSGAILVDFIPSINTQGIEDTFIYLYSA